jgi:hypothetical protein
MATVAAAPPPTSRSVVADSVVPAPEGAASPNAAQPEKNDIPSGMGLLNTANAPPGRRIMVGGHAAGETPNAVLVKCGATTLKIGNGGLARSIDVPCGQEIRVDKP